MGMKIVYLMKKTVKIIQFICAKLIIYYIGR